MSSYITINELSQRTSLNITFIRKCVKQLKPTLDPHIKRGDSNSLLFDNNAIAIFDQIKGHKEDNLTLPQIKKLLEKSLNSSRQKSKTPIKTNQTEGANPNQTEDETGQTQNFEVERLYNKLLDLQEKRIEDKTAHQEEIKTHQQTIQSANRELEQLRGALKLLPQGRTPEQIKGEWEKRQNTKIEIAKIATELKKTSPFRPFKRRELLNQLEKLLDDEQGRGTEEKEV